MSDPELNKNQKSDAQAGQSGAAQEVKVDRGGKYLTFILTDEYYGLDILDVRELIGMMDITHVPQTPPFVKGLLNLRGVVLPVIDLRIKFGLPEMEYTDRTSIIIVEINTVTGSMLMGVIVDTVAEVLNIPGQNVEDAPNFGVSLKTEYIKGMAKVRDKIIILLNMNIILTDEELVRIDGD